jgi:SAM-dependent methyltransferase
VAERPLAEAWEAQAREWERWARTPGHDRHFHLYHWPAFVELLPAPGRATLDLGCGEGRGGVLLRELGHRVTGVDLAPTMARLARETGAYVEVLHADAAALPLADGAFDLVQIHRPLGDWFAMLRDAGYLVEQLREPRPTEADAARYASFARTRADPAFLHLRCVKPLPDAVC